MKIKTSLSILLVLVAQFTFGQTTTFNFALVKSRDYKFGDDKRFVAKKFEAGQPLYPLAKQKVASQSNAVYRMNGDTMQLYVFSNGIPTGLNQRKLNQLGREYGVIRKFTEKADIYLEKDQYGISVMRSGIFSYNTVPLSSVGLGTGTVIIFTPIIDIIAANKYYFDFMGCNTSPQKEYYEWQEPADSKSFLTYMGDGSSPANDTIPQISNIIINDNKLTGGMISIISDKLIIPTTKAYINIGSYKTATKPDSLVKFIKYSIKGINNKMFRIKVKLDYFNSKGDIYCDGITSGIIQPTDISGNPKDSTLKVPDPSTMNGIPTP